MQKKRRRQKKLQGDKKGTKKSRAKLNEEVQKNQAVEREGSVGDNFIIKPAGSPMA